MATIEQNQRRAFLAQATDASRVLAYHLKNLSPAQQAAILASTAAECGCPIDMVMLSEHRIDGLEAATVLDGDLRPTNGWGWKIGSGCEFRIIVTQGDDHE